MSTQSMPWKADPDVFSVSRPAASLIHRMEAAVANLGFTSADPTCTFSIHTRLTDASAGPALVVSEVAQFDSGERQSAVVISAVVHDDNSDDRLVVIRTHVEDQHTAHEDGVIVFEEHHDTIRAVLARAVRDGDPEAQHRSWPDQVTHGVAAAPAESAEDQRPSPAQQIPQVKRAQPRTAGPGAGQPVTASRAQSNVDPRQLAGLGLLILGVVIMFVTIASGTPALIVFGVAAAGALGFAGNHIAGG